MRIGLTGAETLQGGSLKALVVVSVQRMLMPLSHYIGFTWDGFRLCVCVRNWVCPAVTICLHCVDSFFLLFPHTDGAPESVYVPAAEDCRTKSLLHGVWDLLFRHTLGRFCHMSKWHRSHGFGQVIELVTLWFWVFDWDLIDWLFLFNFFSVNEEEKQANYYDSASSNETVNAI